MAFVFSFLALPITSFAANEAENVATVVHYIDHFLSKAQFEWAEKVFHPDGLVHRTLSHPERHYGTFKTVGEMKAHYKAYEKAQEVDSLKKITKRTILDIAADGEVVFVHYAVTGTGKKDNIIGYRVIQLYGMEGGKIKRLLSSTNRSYVVPQLKGKIDGAPFVKPEEAELFDIQPPKSPQNESANVARVIKYYNAREENTVEGTEAIFHAEFGLVNSPPKEPLPGFKALVDGTKDNHSTLKDVDVEILDLAADGDAVFVHSLTTGKVKESGKDYELEELSLYEFVDGKIHRKYSCVNREDYEIIS